MTISTIARQTTAAMCLAVIPLLAACGDRDAGLDTAQAAAQRGIGMGGPMRGVGDTVRDSAVYRDRRGADTGVAPRSP